MPNDVPDIGEPSAEPVPPAESSFSERPTRQSGVGRIVGAVAVFVASQFSREALPNSSANPSVEETRRIAAKIAARCRVLVMAVGVIWLILAARLLQLQVWESRRLSQRADRQRVYVEEISPRPGDIYDREGRLFATTVRVRSLYAVPSQIDHPWATALKLGEAVGVNPDGLLERFRPDRHFAWVKRRLSEEDVARVRELDLPASQWGFREEFLRVYPQGRLAAQVLGLRDIDGVGQGGLEQSCDTWLHGTPGQRQLTRDSRGRVLEIHETPLQMPRDGTSVWLTLDAVVQLFVEEQLDQVMEEWKPQSCCAVVLDPQSGEVLAMASRPTYDPNSPASASADAWKNRVIADIYEPGSTYKPFIVAYGLEQGLIEREETFHCEWGRYRMGRRLLHDHHAYGELSLTDVLVKSSNIGMAKIGERLTNEHLYDASVLFGFGRRTGIELPGELPGILRPLEKWNSYSTGSIPMGHEMAATPLQLIAAHAALANGGQWRKPRIVREITGVDRLTQSVMTQATVSPATAKWVVEGPLVEVVSRGTGKKAQLADYQVFGKTGTAQALNPEGGYQSRRYVSSFICGAPADDPRAMVLVVVNQAEAGSEQFGGKVAAPVAAKILERVLGYLGTKVLAGDRPDATHESHTY